MKVTLTIFDISYLQKDDTHWRHVIIAAVDVKSAIGVAEEMGISLDVITNIQNTRQTIHGIALPCDQ